MSEDSLNLYRFALGASEPILTEVEVLQTELAGLQIVVQTSRGKRKPLKGNAPEEALRLKTSYPAKQNALVGVTFLSRTCVLELMVGRTFHQHIQNAKANSWEIKKTIKESQGKSLWKMKHCGRLLLKRVCLDQQTLKMKMQRNLYRMADLVNFE